MMQTSYESKSLRKFSTSVELPRQKRAASMVMPDSDDELIQLISRALGEPIEQTSSSVIEHISDDETAQSCAGFEDPMLSSMTPLPVARPLDEVFEARGGFAMSLTVNTIQAALKRLEKIDGFIGIALADCDSGVCFGVLDDGSLDIEVTTTTNAELVRSTRDVMSSFSPSDDVEDILISVDTRYHLIHPVRFHPNLFFYLVLDRAQANLAMARIILAEVEREPPSEVR